MNATPKTTSRERTSRSLLVLAGPALLCVALRVVFSVVLDFHPGWGAWAIDYDFLIPAPVIGVLLFNYIQTKKDWSLRFQHGNALLLVGLCAALVFVSAAGMLPRLAWWVLLFTTLATSFLLWLKPRDLLSSGVSSRYLAAGIALMSLPLAKQLPKPFLYSYFSFSEPLLCRVLAVFNSPGYCGPVGEELFLIAVPKINTLAFLSNGCWGGEGLVFLVAVLAVLYIEQTARFWVWLGLLFSGVLFAMLLNVARLVLVVAGVHLAAPFFPRAVLQSAVHTVFHIHFGWVVYLLGSVGYYFFGLYLIRCLKTNAPLSAFLLKQPR